VAPRKRRIRVVLDTNVWAAFFLGGTRPSAVVEIVRLWRDLREIQVVVSDEVVVEYLEVLRRLNLHELVITKFADSLRTRTTVTWVNLGPRVVACRDPDDNLMLTTARAGRVAYLITGDRDLLGLAKVHRQSLRFEIVSPAEFLRRIQRSLH
jgi:putative PIN family toxin of toxin-antitoxin system